MDEQRRRRFGWFPIVAPIVAALAVLITQYWPADEPNPGNRFFVSFSIVGLTIILMAAWLLFFSGLRSAGRLAILGSFLAAAGVAILVFDFELEFDGQMNPSFHFLRKSARRQALAAHLAETPKASAVALTDMSAFDFPEYRNRKRDGVVTGLRLASNWASDPPKQIWRQPCGGGYAGFVIRGNVAVTIEQRPAGETVVAYDAESGRERWATSYDAYFREPLGGNGPRATPTIDGDAVFALGAAGKLLCLDAAAGDRRWEADLLTDDANMQWGQCGAPLVIANRVIVTPGAQTPAAHGKAIRAYDRATGALLWSSGDRQAAYSSPQLSTIAGVPQIVALDAEAVAGFDIETGRELWSHPWPSYQGINVAQPLVFDDGRVFVASGYDHGCAMLKVTKSGDQWSTEQLWANRNLRCKFSSPVAHGEFIYGLDEAFLVCISAVDGSRKWKGNRYGYGQILRSGDWIVVGAETGRLALVAAEPSKFNEAAIIVALPGNKNWNPFAIANGRVYLRNHFEMACFGLPQSQ